MKKKGIALVVIIFFGFCIAIVLFALVNANSNLKSQNNYAINELQTYYLSLSAIQLAKLYIKLLPTEAINNDDKRRYYFLNSDSFCHGGKINLGNEYKEHNAKFSLFKQNTCKNLSDFPFAGSFRVNGINTSSNNYYQLKFEVDVESEIYIDMKNKKKTGSASETFTVSKSSGDFYNASTD